jgi:hypothetical protein
MPALPTHAKSLIVTRLACFSTPSEIQRELKELHGIDASIQQISYYDPTQVDTDVAKKWRDLFTETRATFTKESASLAISHKNFRLRRLERMARALEKKADDQRSPVIQAQLYERAAALYEQAAKEQGEAYTNRRKLEHTGKDGAPLGLTVVIEGEPTPSATPEPDADGGGSETDAAPAP